VRRFDVVQAAGDADRLADEPGSREVPAWVSALANAGHRSGFAASVDTHGVIGSVNVERPPTNCPSERLGVIAASLANLVRKHVP
jgi:hypothetical protein